MCSAGDFVDLVRRGFYNGMEIQRSDGFVMQTGKPEGDVSGAACKWGRGAVNHLGLGALALGLPAGSRVGGLLVCAALSRSGVKE